MGSRIPQTQKAVVTDEKANWVSLREVPVPIPGENEVLIKVEYAAQNAGDWRLTNMYLDGTVQGGDFAGTIIKLGTDLKVRLKIDDKVAGASLYGIRSDSGSFSEYLVAQSDLIFKIPSGLKIEDAATFGVAWGTVGQVFYHHQEHQYPPHKIADVSAWYIVYGASTSVGLFLIQIAKLAGYKVLTFASPHSFDLVKSYGADHVINYRDEDAIQQALDLTGGGADFALDTISDKDSLRITSGSLGQKGKQMNRFPSPAQEPKDINPTIKVVTTILNSILGVDINFTPRTPDTPWIVSGSPAEREFAAAFYQKTPEIIANYGVKANPVDIRGGLEAISTGLQQQKDGKVSGRKLVYKISN
ncbi:uncharacterized protein IL334_003798 [Kwoniella shivajii]|uniref:Enoyl reductase (ER) domain-containing protein n=1 Tax=Kwoniella shivajii TaxID=564305 RepID=A0ABZ1CYJ6_9TREE|nr:hypothetical protein IL334_003798 [Kwoniella shivajii]